MLSVLFFIGWVTGVVFANSGIGIALHDTYYVVAHFYFMFSIGASFLMLGSFYFLFEKTTSVCYLSKIIWVTDATILSVNFRHWLNNTNPGDVSAGLSGYITPSIIFLTSVGVFPNDNEGYFIINLEEVSNRLAILLQSSDTS